MNREERAELLLSIEENQLLDDVMNHPGMKMLLDKAQAMHDQYDTINDIDNLQKLHYRQGQLDILRWILTFHSVTKDTLVQLVQLAEEETARQRGHVEPLLDL